MENITYHDHEATIMAKVALDLNYGRFTEHQLSLIEDNSWLLEFVDKFLNWMER